MWEEFKKFAFKGNVIDLAVGLIIGMAFTAIVKSLANDIIMAAVGFYTHGVAFSKIGYPAVKPVIMYGKFIEAIINFVIIAFVVFIMVKAINKMKAKKEAAIKAPSKEEVLLTEIRDLLKEQKEK
jgi:large conductance mechanosensitive channel